MRSPSLYNERSLSLTARLLVGALLIFATTVAFAPSVAAAGSGPCSSDPNDVQASVRPHKATIKHEPTKVVSASFAGIGTPHQERDCNADCPGKPYIVVVGNPDPNAVLTNDVVASVGICSLVVPFESGRPIGSLYHYVCQATLEGDLGVADDCNQNGSPPHDVFEDFGL